LFGRLCVAAPDRDKAETSPTLVGGVPSDPKSPPRLLPIACGTDHFRVLAEVEINVIRRMADMIGI
jgi:hypothetical protein